jgi:hypothetical protein
MIRVCNSFLWGGGGRLCPLGKAAPDDDECEAVSGIIGGGGTEILEEDLPQCSPQIPLDQTWTRTPATAVGKSFASVGYECVANPQ